MASDPPCTPSQVIFHKWVPDVVQNVMMAYIERLVRTSGVFKLLVGQIGMLLHPAGSRPQVLVVLQYYAD